MKGNLAILYLYSFAMLQTILIVTGKYRSIGVILSTFSMFLSFAELTFEGVPLWLNYFPMTME
jgi:hypothetical protein